MLLRRFFCGALLLLMAAPAAGQVKRSASVVNQPAVMSITLADGTVITPPVFVLVDSAAKPFAPNNPMPVTQAPLAPATSSALSGATTTSQTIGPFTPVLGRQIWLTLSGTWAGRVQLLRSTDGGATKLPLTVAGQSWAVFTGPANEAVVEETVSNATYFLTVSLTSGTLTYQVAQ